MEGRAIDARTRGIVSTWEELAVAGSTARTRDIVPTWEQLAIDRAHRDIVPT